METAIYVLRAPEGFEWLQPFKSDDYDLLRFNGSPRASSWIPIRMKRLTHSEDGRRERPSDFPFGTNQLVLSARAHAALRDVLAAHGELLRLSERDGDEWWIFNCTRVIPALDLDRAKLLRSPDDVNRILIIHEHAFHPGAVSASGAEIFRLAEQPFGKTYFTDRFVERVRLSGLVGLEFSLVGVS